MENIETELAIGVHVWMEHARKELDGRWLVGVGFVKGQQELERAILKGRIGWSRVGVGREAMCQTGATSRGDENLPGPNITAFHTMMLSGHGLPETPLGGSLDNRFKSRMRRRLQFVD